jgi:hypothetical protein
MRKKQSIFEKHWNRTEKPWLCTGEYAILKIAAQTSSLADNVCMERDNYRLGIKPGLPVFWETEPNWQKSIFSAHKLWAKKHATSIKVERRENEKNALPGHSPRTPLPPAF